LEGETRVRWAGVGGNGTEHRYWGGGFWGLVLGMIPGDTFGAWLNLPNSGLFWQKEPVLI